MNRQVALFRGINVGGHNKVPMAPLRDAFRELGFANVTSIIQSGNVCFDSHLDPAATTAAIRGAVATTFDVDVPVLLRTRAEIDAALAAHPYPLGGIEPKLHHVLFLADAAPADAAERIGDHAPSSEYEVIGSEIHVRYPDGSARATLNVTVVDRALDTTATARNLPTVEKIAAALAD
ncbi:MAG: hypothetical protein DHS20C19_29610 [Acidimicrobiales bacterium]|nr:MAG: hypothetical protein DHS20C19_29610 [Acidimicrobiales bacterium]